MFIAKSIKTEHRDIVHDVSFDYHGTRMATCSSDQTVKVWDEGDDGKWVCTASWKTHSGSVWKVTWAHPEFGQVLATCSFDRTAAIWEELSSSSANVKGGTPTNTWLNKASLVDSRTFVTDVQFAPKHLGLLLATCSADGIVRIYESVDLMNLSAWQLQHEIPVTVNNAHISLSCLSWNTSRLDPPSMAVGSDDQNHPNHPKVFIYRYNEAARKWDLVENFKVTEPVNDVQFAPHLGRSFHMVAVASRELIIYSLKELREDPDSSMKHPVKFEVRRVGIFEDHKSLVWRVSWSVTGTRLASSGDDGCVMLWKANYLGQWKCFQVLKANGGMSEVECASTVATSLNSTPASSQMGF